jgi:SAM-dependent methyltransferase
MNLKETQLDFEALVSEAVFGHGFAHYGYWPEGNPDVPSFKLMGEAQQVYFDHMATLIPDGVKTILDVGSGTGSNAKALTEKDYDLECLCPSEQLNQMARAKLPGVDVHTLKFEDFHSDKQFDLCLFAESFHYIELEPALKQAARYATKGMIIFDYFRAPGKTYTDDTRGTHAEFVETVNRLGDFEIIHDVDETAKILPTFYVLDYLKNNHIAPFIGRFQTELKANHWFYSVLLNTFLGKAIAKFQKPGKRHETFASKHEYRLMYLKRN